ncbi:hypothetical protein H5410_009133 [Solanum commersonii]|uniref:Uncharacterized protein n=1 Tax=Solanum commersonii TaxID=4109 RepID=A0A9J6AHU3_SOLCO|nr:hypothetical protein H5410_009133 [Solanum commersonii]
MDEQGVHSPMNAKRSTVSDKRDTASPVQTVTGKDTSNPFMTVILPKNKDEGCSSSRRRLVPDLERDKINTSSRGDNNNVTRSLSSGEEDYVGENYQDAQDLNDDDDSGMSFDSIALHNLDT